MRPRRLAFALILVALSLLVLPLSPQCAQAQEDCDNQCYEGNWDSLFLVCWVGDTPHNCSHCQVVCPSGGGGGWNPENQN